jgi:hypothetical protein
MEGIVTMGMFIEKSQKAGSQVVERLAIHLIATAHPTRRHPTPIAGGWAFSIFAFKVANDFEARSHQKSHDPPSADAIFDVNPMLYWKQLATAWLPRTLAWSKAGPCSMYTTSSRLP